MVLAVERSLAEVGAEHHRPIVRGFGDDGHRPRHFPPVLVQVGDQFDHGPVPGDRGGHGLGTGVAARPTGTDCAG